MMNVKIVALVVFAVVCSVSCHQKSENSETVKPVIYKTSEINTLAGRSAKLIYPEFEAEVHYISEKKIALENYRCKW